MSGVTDPVFLDDSLVSSKKIENPLILTLNFEVNKLNSLIEYLQISKQKG